MKKIIVPTDFSPYSFSALQYAKHFAAINNAAITLVHAGAAFAETGQCSFDHFMNELGHINPDLTEEYIGRCKNELLDSSRDNMSFIFYADYGRMEEEISAFIDQNEYDLLIIGTKGAIGWKEKLFGNHTARLIEKVNCPVLAVTKRSYFKPVSHILFATDLEEDGETSLRFLQKQADLLGAQLSFVHIKLEDTRSMEENAEKYRLYLADILGDDQYKLEMYEAPDVLTGLHRYTVQYPVSIMALLQRRARSLDDLFTISFTRKLAFNGDTPVLIIKE